MQLSEKLMSNVLFKKVHIATPILFSWGILIYLCKRKQRIKQLFESTKSIKNSLSLIWLWLQLGDYEVAWVDAEVGKTEGGMLSLLPLSTPAPPHKSVFVGDIKMADFKQFLASKGVPVLLFFVFCFHKWLLQR